jgi:hypothetical protein
LLTPRGGGHGVQGGRGAAGEDEVLQGVEHAVADGHTTHPTGPTVPDGRAGGSSAQGAEALLQGVHLGEADEVGEGVEGRQAGQGRGGGAVGPERGQQRLDARRGGQQRADRVEHEGEAQLGDAVERDGRGAAALGPVEHQRRDALELVGDRDDVVLAGRGLDEQHVRARVGVRAGPGDRRVQPLDGGGVGAGDEHEVGVAPGGDGGADLADHLARLHHGLAGHVAALLRRHLVLQVQPRHPGLLVLATVRRTLTRCRSRCRVGDHRTSTAAAMRRALSTISAPESSPTSGRPMSEAVVPNPVM